MIEADRLIAAGTIRPFHVDIAAEALNDLRGQLARTREPAKELVDDASQGVQLQTIEKLVRYWRTEYDFGRLRRGSTRCRSS